MSKLQTAVEALPVSQETKQAILDEASNVVTKQEGLYVDELIEEALGVELEEMIEIKYNMLEINNQVISYKALKFRKAAVRVHVSMLAEEQQPLGYKKSLGPNKPARYPRKWGVQVIEQYIGSKLK